MKLLRNICRILVGIVFIYSGFVKGVDPLGSDYKLSLIHIYPRYFRYRLKIFPVGLFARLNSDKQDSNRIPCYLVCSQIHRDSFPAR